MAKSNSKKGNKGKGNKKGSSKARDNEIQLDFSDVEDQSFVIPDGKYEVKVVDVEKKASANKPVALLVHFQVTKGKHKGFKFKEFMSTSESALYRLKQFMEACDIEFKTKGKFSINFDELLDAEGEAVLKAVENNGYTNMNIQTWVIDDEDDDDDDYEDDEDEDEDYDDDDEEDDDEEDEEVEDRLSDLDLSELKDVAKELGIKSTKIKKAKKKKDLIELILEEDEEEIEDILDDLEDDEDDE